MPQSRPAEAFVIRRYGLIDKIITTVHRLFQTLVQSVSLEAVVWLGALAWLALSDPDLSAHFSLCPLKNLGFAWCPGCGLGTSVSLAFHGQIVESIHTHPMGIPAIIILVVRAVSLLLNSPTRFNHKFSKHWRSYGQRNAINAQP
ncbi:MAG TPA: DUF2752 domain-containing protein [Bacteroidota bacterium]